MTNNWRHIILIVVATCLCFATSMAQDFSDHNISVGAKGGLTLSRVNFQPSVPQSMVSGMMFGATVRYIEEKHFGLIAELNLEQRGWRENFKPLTGYSYKRQFTYLQLPLLTHIYFGSERARFFFNAGPEIGVMIGSKISSDFDYQHAADIKDIQNSLRKTEQMLLSIDRKFDYGISAGLGMEINLTRKHAVNLEGRFYYGLNDVFSNHKTDPFSGSSSMSIMVTLGYNYRIK
ncbi:MAG: porin family protein [Bacteroidales bacterium]|nr:porin family protein [Bacteroidales bacterium]